MRTPTTRLVLLAGLLAGCHAAGPETGSGDGECHCGDPDGDGTDTGNIPDLWGNWTTRFGSEQYEDNCDGVPDLDQDSETWINAAMHVGGYVPDGLYAYFGEDEDERFHGVVSQHGGIAFSGTHARPDGHTAYVAFGGLAYFDSYRDKDVIEGFGFMTLDLNGDGTGECWVRGDFTALKSGG